MDSYGNSPRGGEESGVVDRCPRCGSPVEGDGMVCSKCEGDLVGEGSVASTSPVVTPTPLSALKRPGGVTAMCLLWFLGGIVNSVWGVVALNSDLNTLSMLNHLRLSIPGEIRSWASWAIPLDTVLMLSTMVLGILQLITVYGLWNGNSWSHRYGVWLPIPLITIGWIETILTLTAPKALSLQPNFTQTIIITIFGAIYISYLKQDHVKKYLEVP